MIHYYVVRVWSWSVDAIKRLISALVAASPNTGSSPNTDSILNSLLWFSLLEINDLSH